MKMRLITVIIASAMVGACASFPGPSQTEWVKMSKDERVSAAKDAKELEESFTSWWEMVGLRLYRAHQPVRVGNEENGYTVQWHRLPGPFDAVSFYPGHNPPGMSGNSTEGMYTVFADKQGNIIYRQDGSGGIAPNKLLANVTTSEDVGRMVVRGGFQVLTGAANGLGASLVQAANDCGENCGNITLTNVGGVSSAAALSRAVSGSSADVSVQGMCADASCGNAF